MASRERYQVVGNNVQELRNSLNFALQHIGDRLDKNEGIRGGANVESDLDMNDNTINNVDIAATDITADTGTIDALTADTLAVEDITLTGDIFFTGADSGLTYGEISVEENTTTETVIASSGVAVQVTVFNANGHSHHVTPDHAENHILIERAGHYLIVVSATIESVTGSASKCHFEIMKNNGASAIVPHVDRNLAGGSGEAGVISLSGFAELAVDDTVEAWITNESNAANYMVEDVSMAVIQVGGV